MAISLNPRPLSPVVASRVAHRPRLRLTAPLVVATCILAAGCGGGSAPAPCGIATVDGCVSPEAYGTEVASAADEIRSTPEFDLRPSWDLEAVKVPEAWAHLQVAKGEDRPGSGVTVGLIDSGIDLGHPSFDEAVAAGEITEAFLQGAADETGEEFSHGTAVASIIAGRPSPTHGTMYTGIAPWAGLRMFAIPLDDPPPPGMPIEAITLPELADSDGNYAQIFREVLSRDLDFLNLSIGYYGVIDDYDDVPAIRAAMSATIEALAQADREEKNILPAQPRDRTTNGGSRRHAERLRSTPGAAAGAVPGTGAVVQCGPVA